MNEAQSGLVLAPTHTSLRTKARESLRGNWGLAIGVCVVYMLISIAASALGWVDEKTNFLSAIASLVIGGPLILGIAIVFLKLARAEDPQFKMLFDGFKNFGTALGTYLLMLLFIFLWTALLFVPGIIAALSYSMSFYILADNPDIGPREAIRRSKEMMRGHKGRIFMLGLSFFGWILLGYLSLGIGFLWIGPYMQTTFCHFYVDIRSRQGEVSIPTSPPAEPSVEETTP